jgi:hypothetical protein
MIIKFKARLKTNGQSLKWFYDEHIKDKTGLTYSGFTAQLNGYAPIADDVKEEIERYING